MEAGPPPRGDALADRVEILVVGGGILGLTIARELIAQGWTSITVVEKEPALGRHASGRNSGVLHAGIYYPEDSLKARSCLSGNRLMRAYCREKGLPLLECGKVVVARTEAELPVLEELHRRATACGARVRLIDDRELAEIEPMARSSGRALLSLDTAVVDPARVLASLEADLAEAGVRVLKGCRFLGLAGTDVARTSQGDIAFQRFVNAAGAHCDVVAKAFGAGAGLRMVPFKGIYRKLRPGKQFPVNGNIYPVPDLRNPFLGVHFTRNVHGDVYVGPTAIPALGRENYGLLAGAGLESLRIVADDTRLFLRNAGFRNVALTEPRKYIPRFFHRDAARLVRSYEPAWFEPASKVGIRPQLVDVENGALVMDFRVEVKDASVHLLNPISPAFTCSMDLAKRVVESHLGRRAPTSNMADVGRS